MGQVHRQDPWYETEMENVYVDDYPLNTGLYMRSELGVFPHMFPAWLELPVKPDIHYVPMPAWFATDSGDMTLMSSHEQRMP